MMALGQLPIRGRQAIHEYIESTGSIPGFSIRWEPLEAHVSASGRHCASDRAQRVIVAELDRRAGDVVEGRDGLAATPDGSWKNVIDMWNAEDHELIRYDDVLDHIARERGLTVRYHRHPIRDVGVPRSRDDMHAILACIDTSLRAGDPVYEHCWGGVGRTGTVIGCYLVGCGLSGDDALRKLGELFGAMEKSATKRSPETDAQKRCGASRRRAVDELPVAVD